MLFEEMIEELKTYETIRKKQLLNIGFSENNISRLLKEGKVEKIGVGKYKINPAQFLPTYENYLQLGEIRFRKQINNYLAFNNAEQNKQLVFYLSKLITKASYPSIIKYIELIGKNNLNKCVDEFVVFLKNNLRLCQFDIALLWKNVINESIELEYSKFNKEDVKNIIIEWSNNYLLQFYNYLENNLIDESKKKLDEIIKANKFGFISSKKVAEAGNAYISKLEEIKDNIEQRKL